MIQILFAVLGVLLFVLLTVGTGLAVAAEFSLTALERSTVDAQVAITLTTLVTGYLAEPLIGELVRPLLTAAGLPTAFATGAAIVLALVVATSLSMILGEMVPKNLAIARPLPTARAVVGYHSR